MTALIIPLITQFGIPLARQIWEIVSQHTANNQPPTAEMWDKLAALENESHAAFAEALTTKITLVHPIP